MRTWETAPTNFFCFSVPLILFVPWKSLFLLCWVVEGRVLAHRARRSTPNQPPTNFSMCPHHHLIILCPQKSPHLDSCRRIHPSRDVLLLLDEVCPGSTQFLQGSKEIAAPKNKDHSRRCLINCKSIFSVLFQFQKSFLFCIF